MHLAVSSSAQFSEVDEEVSSAENVNNWTTGRARRQSAERTNEKQLDESLLRIAYEAAMRY